MTGLHLLGFLIKERIILRYGSSYGRIGGFENNGTDVTIVGLDGRELAVVHYNDKWLWWTMRELYPEAQTQADLISWSKNILESIENAKPIRPRRRALPGVQWTSFKIGKQQ